MSDSSFVRLGGELRLSNFGQLELLRGLTERDKTLRTRVRGFSMVPFICDGDVLTVAAINGRMPKTGDVIAFIQTNSGKLAIHRVIDRKAAGWLLCGDNCPDTDGFIPRDQLIGRVMRVERNGRIIRFGLGFEKRIIAWLVRHDLLSLLKRTCALPRRQAAAFLHRLQDHMLYRSFAALIFKGVSIVEATDEELAAVPAFFNSNEPVTQGNPGPGVTNYVARRRSKCIGFIQLIRFPEPDRPMTGHWIFSLMVRSRYRGLGIGESLTRCVIDRSVRDEASELSLLVFQDNLPAVRLYEKLGFEPIFLPALEPQLEAEKLQHGRRRMVMRKPLRSN